MGELRRCSRCLLPETHETIVFDSEGVCNVCRGQEIKQAQADWADSKAQRDQLLQDFKRSLDLKNANAMPIKEYEQAESACRA